MSDQPVQISDDDAPAVVVVQEAPQVVNPFSLDWEWEVSFDFRPDAPQNVTAGVKAGPVDETAPKEVAAAPALKVESPLLMSQVSARTEMGARMMEKMTSTSAPSSEPSVDAGAATSPTTATKIDLSDPI